MLWWNVFVFSRTYFYHKKVHIKWDVVISSSLRLLMKVWIWYRCQNRIENYYHHDGEQLGFYKKVHIKTQSKKKDVLVIFILLLYNPLYYCKKRRTPIYLIKTVPKRNIKRTLFHNSIWRKLTWMHRNWTGKLQVTLLSAHISRKKLCSQTFKASSEEVIVMYSEKMKAKYMKEDVWRSFFR